jgi:hypothetical protein
MSAGRVFDVVWWIVSGVLLLTVVVFAVVLATLGGRLRPLRRAVGRLRLRAEEAEKLQTKVMAVQERALDLAERVEEVSAAAQRWRPGEDGGDGGDDPPPGGFDGGTRARASR